MIFAFLLGRIAERKIRRNMILEISTAVTILYHTEFTGCVVSEHIGAGASADIYKGLHFPSADIPKQARALYMINTIRVLYDREQETARLVCRDFEDAKTPLDLKHSYLRAMSPIHIKYLGNMGVRASMSISLMVGGKLWGLVSCHSYGTSMRVSLPVMELCRGLGSVASGNIEKLIYASQMMARKPLFEAPRPKTSPSTYIAASSLDLLNMFGADFGFLVIKGEARTIGTLLAYAESIALLHYIRKRAFTTVVFSHEVMKDYEDIAYLPGFSVISGMLVIPLGPSGGDFLVFFRQGRLKEVNWAGNPHEKIVGPGSNYLEPRSSFKRWSETVIGTSREWTEHEGLSYCLPGRFE
jgi:light-regulated signal transduction histidine kinase (bacteriophytochrome)